MPVLPRVVVVAMLVIVVIVSVPMSVIVFTFVRHILILISELSIAASSLAHASRLSRLPIPYRLCASSYYCLMPIGFIVLSHEFGTRFPVR